MILIKIPATVINEQILCKLNTKLQEEHITKVGSDYNVDASEYYIFCKDGEDIFQRLFSILQNIFTEDILNQINVNYVPKQKERNKKMEQEILSALKEDRVVIYLQPIYSNKAKRFVSGEVLTRIIKSDGSILSPGDFIPVAEQSKLINLLERRILEKTLQFLAENDIHKLGLKHIELNMSIKTGERDDFVDICNEILNQYKINPKTLNVEITETASISEKKNLLNNMRQLIDKGFQFSLDDFGSGYSNLNYVIDMPVSIIKFDLAMTKATECNDKAFIVMKNAVHMAHELQLTTIAEGVETKESLERMVNMGIDYIQGYYFSKPLPVDKFVTFLQEHNKD